MANSTVFCAGAHERKRISERVSQRKAVGRQERERLWAVTQSCDLEETLVRTRVRDLEGTLVRKGLFVAFLNELQ